MIGSKVTAMTRDQLEMGRFCLAEGFHQKGLLCYRGVEGGVSPSQSCRPRQLLLLSLILAPGLPTAIWDGDDEDHDDKDEDKDAVTGDNDDGAESKMVGGGEAVPPP